MSPYNSSRPCKMRSSRYSARGVRSSSPSDTVDPMYCIRTSSYRHSYLSPPSLRPAPASSALALSCPYLSGPRFSPPQPGKVPVDPVLPDSDCILLPSEDRCSRFLQESFFPSCFLSVVSTSLPSLSDFRPSGLSKILSIFSSSYGSSRKTALKSCPAAVLFSVPSGTKTCQYCSR